MKRSDVIALIAAEMPARDEYVADKERFAEYLLDKLDAFGVIVEIKEEE